MMMLPLSLSLENWLDMEGFEKVVHFFLKIFTIFSPLLSKKKWIIFNMHVLKIRRVVYPVTVYVCVSEGCGGSLGTVHLDHVRQRQPAQIQGMPHPRPEGFS